MIQNGEVIFRVLLSGLLSGVIGLEREFRQKDAGLRTHILVGIGSTLIVLTSIYLSDIYKSSMIDPTRMIAGIIQGIGFLCGGVILQAGRTSVKGLTSAATLWIVSGIGIAVGVGDYMTAMIVSLVVALVLIVVRKVEFSIKDKVKNVKPVDVE